MPKLRVLVLLIAITLMLATFGAGWKWGGGKTSRAAGWTSNDNASSLR